MQGNSRWRRSRDTEPEPEELSQEIPADVSLEMYDQRTVARNKTIARQMRSPLVGTADLIVSRKVK